MNKNKKIFLLMFITIFLFSLVSCKDKNNDKPCETDDNQLINNNNDSNNNDNNNSNIDKNDDEQFGKSYLHFDGGGMEFNIFIETDPTGIGTEDSYKTSLFNPFSKYYTSSDKTEKQLYHRSVEAKYNVKINYIEAAYLDDKYPCLSSDYLRTIESYNYHHSEGSIRPEHPIDEECPLQNKIKSTYAIISNTLLKPGTYGSFELVYQGGCNLPYVVYDFYDFLSDTYVQLYDTKNDSGLLKDVNDNLEKVNIDLGTYFGQTYTYVPQQVFNTNFLLCESSVLDELKNADSYINKSIIYNSYKTISELLLVEMISNKNYNSDFNIFDYSDEQVKNLYSELSYGYKHSHNINDKKAFVLDSVLDLIHYFEGSKLEALQLPSNLDYNFVNSAPGYSFLNFEALENGFNSEVAFKIIYELEEGYRTQSSTSDMDKFKEKLENSLDVESVNLILSNQDNLKFLPYYRLFKDLLFLNYNTASYFSESGPISSKKQISDELKDLLNIETDALKLKYEISYRDSSGSDIKETSMTLLEFLDKYNKLIFDAK